MSIFFCIFARELKYAPFNTTYGIASHPADWRDEGVFRCI